MKNLMGGIVFLLVSCILYFALTKPLFTKAQSSKNWPATIGTVTKNHVDPNAGEDNNMYTLRFTYNYTIDGQEYTTNGRHLDYGEGNQSWKGDLYKFAKAHPVGSTIKVYYNPKSPEHSTIIRGMVWWYWLIGAFNTIFFLAGLSLVFKS